MATNEEMMQHDAEQIRSLSALCLHLADALQLALLTMLEYGPMGMATSDGGTVAKHCISALKAAGIEKLAPSIKPLALSDVGDNPSHMVREMLAALKWMASLFNDEGELIEQHQDQLSVALEKMQAAIAKGERWADDLEGWL